MITVRQATLADADVLARLNHDFNRVPRDARRVRQALRAETSRETVLLAEEAGAVVGFMCLQTLWSVCYDAPWVEITELYVAPTHRRCGAGRALIREGERRAEGSGASELLLRTNTKNRSALGLFRRAGLERAVQVVFRRFYPGRGLTRGIWTPPVN
jgi:ribosomal protein S18 acetylase RimI-like enzyme